MDRENRCAVEKSARERMLLVKSNEVAVSIISAKEISLELQIRELLYKK